MGIATQTIKVTPPSKQNSYTSRMKWLEDKGQLLITGTPDLKTNVIIGSDSYAIEFDKDGLVILEFAKSESPIKYVVKLKDAKETDQSVAIYY